MNGFEGLTVTVAGGTGFVGTNVIDGLIGTGCKIRAIVHKKPPQVERSGVDYLVADLTNQADCGRALKDTDIFIMAAAVSSGAAVMRGNPLAHLTPNLVMNALTLEAARLSGVRKYCFISSNTVYPVSPDPMREEDASGDFFEGYRIVAEMKWFSEKMVAMHHRDGGKSLDTVIIRPGNLYGPFDKFTTGEAKVIPALISRAEERETPFTVWGDGKEVKDFLYISDFTEAFKKSLVLKQKEVVLNIASGTPVDISSVAQEILALSGHPEPQLTFDSSKPTMIPVRRIDIGRAKRLLDWAPAVDLTGGLRQTIEWYRRSFNPVHPGPRI